MSVRLAPLSVDTIHSQLLAASDRLSRPDAQMALDLSPCFVGSHGIDCRSANDTGGSCIEYERHMTSVRLDGYHKLHWLKEYLSEPSLARKKKFLETGLM